EKVLKMQPDLILGSTYSEDIYDQLSQIAPTVLAKYDGSDSWKAIHQTVGEAVNQTEKTEQILDDYWSRLEMLREKLGDRADTIEISVVRIYPDRISLIQKGSFSGSILEDVQLSRPPSQRGNEVGRNISKEQLPLADGDVIFVWTHTNTEQERRKTKSVIQKLQTDPLWSQLEAVQQEKVYHVNGSYWIGSGPIAANLVIDDLFRYLVEEEESSS
ncbi:MAG: iron-siderophore ABC transporter substrate-binding protein, partial [Kamptonema sp. SIO4C4]|nr:iron-siderophore ABC transporter substrate-binding protein [Kamptonema sp. SIO4C4]